jgi:type II secretory pathway component GspD/PulD (secretin)
MYKKIIILVFILAITGIIFSYPLFAQATYDDSSTSASSSMAGGSASQSTTTQQASNQITSLLSSEGKVLYGNEPNSIMVMDYPDNIQHISEFLDIMDAIPPQVVIEARVVEVKLQGEHALGVNWTLVANGKTSMHPFGFLSDWRTLSPITQSIPYKNTSYPPATTGGTVENPFTLTIFDKNINMVISTLANSLKTEVLSAPRVTTVNNRDAEMKVVQKLPWAEPTVTTSTTGITITWAIKFESVGITLKVRPTITEDGSISMVLTPEISEHTSDYPLTVTAGGETVDYTVPVIDSRSASTKVIVGNGQTLIIGGLIKDTSTKGATKVPYLGDIPILGNLFGGKKNVKNKTELLIFVSPTIVTPAVFMRHAREERFGASKVFTREREAKERTLRLLDESKNSRRENVEKTVLQRAQNKVISEETERKTLENLLKELNNQQKSLFEERKKLEEALVNEETEFNKLRIQEDSLTQPVKQLNQNFKGAPSTGIINGP